MDFINDHLFVIIWTLIIVVAVIAEVSTATLVSVWFAVGAGTALVLALLGAPFWLQIVLALLVSFGTLWLCHRFIIRAGRKGDKTEVVAKHALVGKTAKVTQSISNVDMRGQICVDGDYWSAKSASDEPIAEGQAVIILQVGSAVCIVETDPLHSSNS